MPLYDVRCPNCQYTEEKLLRNYNPKLELCPKCGQAKLEKIISPSNFILNGKNWAKDGYGLRKTNKKPNKRKPK
jgi:putative FmdB family regulatory protein